MKLTLSVSVATIVLSVIALDSQVVSGFADGPPRLNVGPSCAAAAKGAVSTGRDKEACMDDEHAAQEVLAKNWSQYSGTDKTQCVGLTNHGGASYVELISCLDIMRDANAIRKADPYSDPTGEKPRPTPSNPPARRSAR